MDRRMFERKTQIDLPRQRSGSPVSRRRIGEGFQIDDPEIRPTIGRAFRLCQRQQLIGKAARAHGRRVHALDLGANVVA